MLAAILFALILAVGTTDRLVAEDAQSFESACNVTQPNGRGAARQQPNPALHGNGLLSIYLGSPDTTVIFRPNGGGFVTSDGALGIKFGWMRGAQGRLTISGRRLDAPAAPLRSQVNSVAYGNIGLQPSYLIFTTPGCWEVTGQVGNRRDSRLSFVLRVVKIGDGPMARLDP
jgi:hypothetical protein